MDRGIHLAARLMALTGGAVLLAVIGLTCLSITGRGLADMLHSDVAARIAPGLAEWLLGLGIGGVNGDIELTEAGIAFAVFAFLPICHLTGGHARVDIFARFLPVRLERWLSQVIAVLFAAAMVLIAWQLASGTVSKWRSGQTTTLLEMPLWWAYAACLTGAVLAAAVAVWRVFRPGPET